MSSLNLDIYNISGMDSFAAHINNFGWNLNVYLAIELLWCLPSVLFSQRRPPSMADMGLVQFFGKYVGATNAEVELVLRTML